MRRYVAISVRRFVVGLVLVVLLTRGAVAAPIPGGAVSGDGNTLNSQTLTQGWEFRTLSPLTITALGVHDAGGDGLADPHEVGLWTTAGELLATATVPEGTAGALVANFRYIDIQPVTVNSGQNLVIGALYLGVQGGGALDPDPADRDLYHSIGGARTFAPQVQFINPRSSSQQTSGLLFPIVMTPPGFPASAIMGPNFLFEPIPEPSSAAIAAFAAAAALARRRPTGD